MDVEMPKDESLKSTLHMFQKEADRIDTIIITYLSNIEQCHRGNLEPYAYLAYSNLKHLFIHIKPLMSEQKKIEYRKLIEEHDKFFYFKDPENIGESKIMETGAFRVIMILDELFDKFMEERQKVGLGVAAGRIPKWAAATKGLKELEVE